MDNATEETLFVNVHIDSAVNENEIECTWYYNYFSGKELKLRVPSQYTFVRFQLTDATAAQFDLCGVEVTPNGDIMDLKIYSEQDPNSLLLSNSHEHTGQTVGSVSLVVQPNAGSFPQALKFKAGTLKSDPEVVNTGKE